MKNETRLVKLLFSTTGAMLTDIYVSIGRPITMYDVYIGMVEYTDGTYLDVYQASDGQFIGEECLEDNVISRIIY